MKWLNGGGFVMKTALFNRLQISIGFLPRVARISTS
jgi:hypothetical protein